LLRRELENTEETRFLKQRRGSQFVEVMQTSK